MAKAKQLPSGSWRVLVYEGKNKEGKRIYTSFTAPTEKEANYQALDYQLHQKTSNLPENMTFSDALDKYIQTK